MLTLFAVASTKHVLFALGSLAFLSGKSVASAAGTVSNEDVRSKLLGGDPSRFNPSASLTVTDPNQDGDCFYTLSFSYEHDASLPVPTDYATQCNTTDPDPPVADDGITYLKSREHYYDFGSEREDILKYTAFDHVSIDFNSCGHAPPGIWTTAHYDLHFYLEGFPIEVRETMACELADPNLPECAPLENQTEASGQLFYEVSTNDEGRLINAPDVAPDYLWLPSAGVAYSGSHAIFLPDAEIPAEEWINPTLVVGVYNKSIPFWEPMFPLAFLTGDEANSYQQDVSYVDQTIMSLPASWSAAYDPSTKRAEFTFQGLAEACPSAENEASSATTTPHLIGLFLAIVVTTMSGVF